MAGSETPLTPLAPPDPTRRGTDALAAGLAAFLLLATLAWVRDLWDADEGRYAAVALDMRRSGDFVTPRENGMRFLDKPPLVYWAENAAFSVLGPGPFAARLPCLVAGAFWCALAFLFARAWTGSRRTGWLAALMAATCAGGQGFSRLVSMDMPLAAASAGALYAGWRAIEEPRRRWRVLLGACVGLGFLSKGLLGVACPALVALAWGFAGIGWRKVFRLLFDPLAWAVALLVAAPWYALSEAANPGFLEHFFLYEHVRRFREVGNRDFAPFWIYLPALLAFLLPWAHLLLGARIDRTVEGARAKPLACGRFAWAWAIVLLMFFSAGRNRLFTYVLPALLPLVVLAAARLSDAIEKGGRSLRFAAYGLASFGLLAGVLGGLLHDGLPFRWFPKSFADPRWSAVGLPLVFAAIPMALAPLATTLARSPAARAAALLLPAAVLAIGADLARAKADDLRSARALATLLAREARPGDAIVTLDVFPQGVRFFEDLAFSVADSREDRRQREIVEPWASKDGAGRLLLLPALESMWSSQRRVILVVRAAKARPWKERGGRVIAEGLAGGERSDLVVLENRGG